MKIDNINKDKNVVTKDFRLIQARYHLSLVEQKMILTIISLIQPHDTDFMVYQIPVNYPTAKDDWASCFIIS